MPYFDPIGVDLLKIFSQSVNQSGHVILVIGGNSQFQLYIHVLTLHFCKKDPKIHIKVHV